METKWFYAQHGKQLGPISTEALRSQVAQGLLSGDDLVWRDGMPNWLPAKNISGLAPSPAASVEPGRTPSSPSMSSSPISLWNPTVIRVLGFFLTWGFGAWLLASNWKALDQPEKANRAMYWFYGLLVYLVINLVAPLGMYPAMGILIAWALLENEPQRKLVLATYGKDYDHRPWGKPVGIALGCFVAYLILLISVHG